MAIHERITSIDDIDFDALFEGSLPRMDAGTFPWPDGVNSREEKRAWLRQRVESAFTKPGSHCYKVTVDDEIVGAIFGRIVDGTFYGTLSLLRPNRHGSRSYVYRQDVLDDAKAFHEACGITEFLGFMPARSPLRDTIHDRHPVEYRHYPRGHGTREECDIIKIRY